MAPGSDTSLYRAIPSEIGRLGEGDTARGRLRTPRTETEAYLAESRGDARRGKMDARHPSTDCDIDYKSIKKEAKAEYRKAKDTAARTYEERLEEVRSAYLRDAMRMRQAYQTAKDMAREEMEQMVDDARQQYKFAVEMARDIKDETVDESLDRPKKEAHKVAKGEERVTRIRVRPA